MIALHFVHDSPVLMLSTCSVLNALAAYVQYSYVSDDPSSLCSLVADRQYFYLQLDGRVLSQLVSDEDDDDMDDNSV